jgi:hypothetical protein
MKMRIKITEANRAKINAMLDELNGKATEHTASAENIFKLAEAMETKLDRFSIFKKDRSGAKASGMSGGDVPSAYKYSRIINDYTIERGSSEWFLIAVSKYSNYGNAAKNWIMLTPAQRDIAVSKFTALFGVQKVVELAVAA